MNKAILVMGVLSGLCVGCYRYSPSHCGNNLGDAFCPEGTFCDGCSAQNDGCVAEPPSPACYLPAGFEDGAEAEGASSGSSDTTVGSTTIEPPLSTTSGSTGTTTSLPGCVGDDECLEPSRPFCGPVGECVSCEGVDDPDGACLGADASMPVCTAGSCVACTSEQIGACEGQTPICGEGNTCIECTEHDQCPQSACHLDGEVRGACFDEAEVTMVVNEGELAAAIDALEPDDRAVLVLAQGSYSNGLDLPSGVEIAILGQGDTVISSNDGGLYAVELGASSITYFRGIDIANNNLNGLACAGTSVWLDDSAVRNNAQLGMTVTGGCAAHLRRSVVRANSTGGVEVSGLTTALRAENSLIVDNVGPAAGPGLRVTAADVQLTYSVVASNGTFASPVNVECLSNVSGVITNSIIAGPAGDSIVTCGALTWDYNALDTAGLGGTNDVVGAYDGAWFVNPGVTDYHLTSEGETDLMDVALWQDSDPLFDVDGDPIPMGMPSFPGYDQP